MKKSVMNSLVKKIAEKQNAKKKLNAGQIREVMSLFLKSLVELSSEQKLELAAKIVK